ncbi:MULTISPECIES: hypothetical protein [unclassified Streptomyces]|uniref:hypothetical protein n=1 Tax=unclassified Streptomyces TaxID=2593676 RepID=UPI003433B349
MIDTSRFSPKEKALIDQVLAKLPAGWQQHATALAAKYGINDTQFAGLLRSAINSADYQCRRTALGNYADHLLDGIKNPDVSLVLNFLGVFNLPAFDSLLFGSESKSNAFGVDGEYTNKLTSEMKNLKRFWDIPSDDIQLVPMHGGDLFSSPERLAPVVSFAYGTSPENSLLLASALIDMPALQGGNNPMFTFNAFAFSEQGSPESLGIPDSIIMGDGILAVGSRRMLALYTTR